MVYCRSTCLSLHSRLLMVLKIIRRSHGSVSTWLMRKFVPALAFHHHVRVKRMGLLLGSRDESVFDLGIRVSSETQNNLLGKMFMTTWAVMEFQCSTILCGIRSHEHSAMKTGQDFCSLIWLYKNCKPDETKLIIDANCVFNRLHAELEYDCSNIPLFSFCKMINNTLMSLHGSRTTLIDSFLDWGFFYALLHECRYEQYILGAPFDFSESGMYAKIIGAHEGS